MLLPIRVALVFSFLAWTITLQATVDTLKQYDPLSNKVSYTNVSALWYMARLDLEAPGKVITIRLYLDGTGKGSLRLFGHEAGSPYAELEEDLISPIEFEKTDDGPTFIDIELEQPVLVDNNQMFVVVDIRNSSLSMMRDTKQRASTCKSGSGGEYFPTVLAVPGNHQFYSHLWSVIRYPMVVEVVMDIRESTSGNHFIDITEDKGLPLDMSMKSVAWGDYNEDGYLDLMVAGRLFRNNGTSKDFTEVTDKVGLPASARANAFLDIDNDKDLDILIFSTENTLYLNNGNGSFSKTQLSLPEFPYISSFSIGDVNADGFADLFVGQLWGKYPVPGTNYLFLNDKQGGFTDATKNIYPQYDGETNYPGNTACDPDNSATFLSGGNRARRSRGSQFVDYDNDGDLDLYVVNYFLEQDEFYENDGKGNFTNIIESKGIDKNASGSNHGTGVDWMDYDNDGDMDLLLTQFAHPWGVKSFDHRGTTIYENSGAPDYSFVDTKGENGIQYEETHAGAAFGDADNDGLQDFVITTYYGCRYIDFYKQQDDGTFSNRTFQYGLENIVTGEDAVWVDYDNDGRLDLCLGSGGKFRLYKNDYPSYHKRYIQIELKDQSTLAGARVEVSVNGKTYVQEVSIGRGQKMQKPTRLHFGLNQETEIESVKVTWPDAQEDVFDNLEVNKLYTIERGAASVGLTRKPADMSIQLYPNPTEGLLRLSGASSIRLMTTDGRLLIEREYEEPRQNELNLWQYGLKPGVYFVELSNENIRTCKRIVLL